MEKNEKDKLIKYPIHWEVLLKQLAVDNYTNVNHEIKMAILDHLTKNGKL